MRTVLVHPSRAGKTSDRNAHARLVRIASILIHRVKLETRVNVRLSRVDIQRPIFAHHMIKKKPNVFFIYFFLSGYPTRTDEITYGRVSVFVAKSRKLAFAQFREFAGYTLYLHPCEWMWELVQHVVCLWMMIQ